MRIFLVLMMALFSFACASKPSLPSSDKNALNPTSAAGFFEEDTTLSPAVSAETEVRPGFLIQLSSPLDTKLNGAFRVPMDGNLRLPYGVSVSAAGCTLQNLNMRISDQLQKFYKKSPQVKATISERKYYIEVRGLVQKPGILLVSEREKIEDIMKKSGEIDLAGDARQVQVIRGQNTFYVSLQEYFQGAGMNLSPRWYGGEKVLFMKSSTALGGEATGVIQLLGDIRNPGALSFKSSADLYYYLVKAGGTTPTSDLSRIQVVRQTANGRAITSGTAEELAKHIVLEPEDTVFVSSALPGRFERNIQVGSLLATILSTIAILVIAF